MVLKTNAPFSFLKKMVLEWEKLKKQKDYKSEIDFSEDQELKETIKRTIPRFLPNPKKNWETKSAAVIKKKKKQKNQFKKLKKT